MPFCSDFSSLMFIEFAFFAVNFGLGSKSGIGLGFGPEPRGGPDHETNHSNPGIGAL